MRAGHSEKLLHYKLEKFSVMKSSSNQTQDQTVFSLFRKKKVFFCCIWLYVLIITGQKSNIYVISV